MVKYEESPKKYSTIINPEKNDPYENLLGRKEEDKRKEIIEEKKTECKKSQKRREEIQLRIQEKERLIRLTKSLIGTPAREGGISGEKGTATIKLFEEDIKKLKQELQGLLNEELKNINNYESKKVRTIDLSKELIIPSLHDTSVPKSSYTVQKIEEKKTERKTGIGIEHLYVRQLEDKDKLNYFCQYCFKKVSQVYKCTKCGLELCSEHVSNHSCIKRYKMDEEYIKEHISISPIKQVTGIFKTGLNGIVKFWNKIKYILNKKPYYNRFSSSKFFNVLVWMIILSLTFAVLYSNIDLINKIVILFPLGNILLLINGIFWIKYAYQLLKGMVYWYSDQKNWIKYLILLIILFLALQSYQQKETLFNPLIDFTNPVKFDLEKEVPSVTIGALISTNTPNPVAQAINQSKFKYTYTDLDVSEYMSNPKTVNLKYILHGVSSQIPYTVYEGMNDYLRSQPREISYYEGQSQPTDIDFIMRDLNNEKQKSFINPLTKRIQNITSNRDDQARIAISIVQNINYDWNGFKTGDINGKYPYEVLYTGSGVCSEKSELLAYMLRELGYGVVIFRFNVESHDAVGIRCPQSYSYQNSGYCFVESTTPSIITDSSGDYTGVGKLTSTPKELKISDGNSFDSVSEEYNDAITWNSISVMGKVLDEYNYNKWLSLENKYGIETTKN